MSTNNNPDPPSIPQVPGAVPPLRCVQPVQGAAARRLHRRQGDGPLRHGHAERDLAAQPSGEVDNWIELTRTYASNTRSFVLKGHHEIETRDPEGIFPYTLPTKYCYFG